MKCEICGKAKATETITGLICDSIRTIEACIKCRPIAEKMLKDGVLPKGKGK